MTALTIPARPAEDDAGPGPVPWRQLAWVTWRQHRFALGGVAVLLAGLALYLWVSGSSLHHAYAAAAACRPASSYPCQNQLVNFDSAYGSRAQAVATLLLAVPMLIGAFVGAPVLARELETGTFRYAWTLGVGRRRWAVAKLVPLAVTVAVAAGLFSMVFSWYYQPLFADGSSIPLDPKLFGLRGIAYAAWTLAGFAIGALVGLLVRRVVPAIAVTLAVCFGLDLRDGAVLATALPGAATWQEPVQPACFSVGHQRVVDQGRCDGQPVRAEPARDQPVPAGHDRNTAQERQKR